MKNIHIAGVSVYLEFLVNGGLFFVVISCQKIELKVKCGQSGKQVRVVLQVVNLCFTVVV